MPHPPVTSRHPAKAAVPGTPSDWAPTTATIALLSSLGVLIVGQMYTVLALLHHMALSLKTTPEQVTWTATAFGFAYAAGFLIAGPLTDRYGPRAVMAAGLVAACSSAPAWDHNWPAPHRPGLRHHPARRRGLVLGAVLALPALRHQHPE
ncbi:MFS transporter [Actinacidiphila oryziradicis]|uniref:MFS transporter n=1 Tax=Actinacidiphila oryziradicis TaxID=2571141 RepID=UPI00145EBA82|nr:MFS transporter [Actinacidiphila oryziradicis]